jgi:hypothetical protein
MFNREHVLRYFYTLFQLIIEIRNERQKNTISSLGIWELKTNFRK